MTCEHVQPGLIGYLLGAIDDDARVALEDHLPTCPACVVELMALKRALDGGLDGPAPPAAAHVRLRAAIAAELRPRPRRRWERSLAFALAAVAVLAAVQVTRVVTGGPGHAPLQVRGT